MKFQKISIRNVGSKDLDWELNGRSAAIYGRTGAGKSQILRAVELLLSGGSTAAAKVLKVTNEDGKVSAILVDDDGVRYFAEGTVADGKSKLSIASEAGGQWSTVGAIYKDLFGSPIQIPTMQLVAAAGDNTSYRRMVDEMLIRPATGLDLTQVQSDIKKAEANRKTAKAAKAEAEKRFSPLGTPEQVQAALNAEGPFNGLAEAMQAAQHTLDEAIRAAGAIAAYDEAVRQHGEALASLKEEMALAASLRIEAIDEAIAALLAEKAQIEADGYTSEGVRRIEKASTPPARPVAPDTSEEQARSALGKLMPLKAIADAVAGSRIQAMTYVSVAHVKEAEKSVIEAREALASLIATSSLPDWAKIEVDGDIPTILFLHEEEWKELHQLSRGSALRFIIKLAATTLKNSNTRILITEDAALLDTATRQELFKIASEEDIQLLMEVTSDDQSVKLVINEE